MQGADLVSQAVNSYNSFRSVVDPRHRPFTWYDFHKKKIFMHLKGNLLTYMGVLRGVSTVMGKNWEDGK